jgi:hypothetical protein
MRTGASRTRPGADTGKAEIDFFSLSQTARFFFFYSNPPNLFNGLTFLIPRNLEVFRSLYAEKAISYILLFSGAERSDFP